MQEKLNLPADLQELERSLHNLGPAAVGIDRDRLMFDAGRAAATTPRGRERIWQGICATLAITCVGVWMWKPAALVSQTVVKENLAPVIALPGDNLADSGAVSWPMPTTDYLQMRAAALRGDFHAPSLPTGAQTGAGPRPVLRTSEGLEALPAWQRQVALFGIGGRS